MSSLAVVDVKLGNAYVLYPAFHSSFPPYVAYAACLSVLHDEQLNNVQSLSCELKKLQLAFCTSNKWRRQKSVLAGELEVLQSEDKLPP